MVVITIFNAVDDFLSTKWNPGLIMWIFKSALNYLKDCIISLSLMFFIAFVRMLLQPYTYITYMYLFTLLGVIWKSPHKRD